MCEAAPPDPRRPRSLGALRLHPSQTFPVARKRFVSASQGCVKHPLISAGTARGGMTSSGSVIYPGGHDPSPPEAACLHHDESS